MRDLNDMMIFANVAEAGGFSAAAARLELPKSNVSRRVSRLEAALGIRLLERTTRKVRLTEAGGLYYEHCRRMLEEAEYAEQSINELMERPRGVLLVSASVTTGQHLLSPHLTEFIERYPDIDLRLQLSNRHVDIIEEGFDVVIRIGKLEDSSLVSRLIGASQLNLYASPAYLETHGTPKDPATLASHQCLIMSDADDAHHWRLEGPEGVVPVSVKPRAVINDYIVIRQMVADGAGIAVLPSHLCRDERVDGKLVRILPDWCLPSVEFHALYPSRRGATLKLRAFLDFLKEKIAPSL